jgi:uncharacterized damage-inducible protein DinB
MDEYERAWSDLRLVLRGIPEDEFTKVIDEQTRDQNCRSVQTIITHVERAGYGYADYIREKFGIPPATPAGSVVSCEEAEARIDAMLDYTVHTLDGRWEMPEDEVAAVAIDSRWGVRYDLEQLLEHAIVHILRHRRQIERLRQMASSNQGA